ncbi:MAG TPA: ATP-binding protein [Verrucomicrobiae bacterium]|nr:ATP-binding protein [Verrucomicrobiae bacterium]
MIRRAEKKSGTRSHRPAGSPHSQPQAPGVSIPSQPEDPPVLWSELDSIYQHAPVGFCFMDRDLRYIRINERLARMGGRTVAEHIGHTLREVFPDWVERMEPMLRRVLETGEPVENLKVNEPNLRPRFSATSAAEVSCYPVRNAEGRIVGLSAMVVDVTEREKALRHYTEELERRVVERTGTLQESVQSLEGVLYHVAHDLRAPLRAMQGLTTLLLEEYGSRFDNEGRDYAGRIVTAASRMDALIRDLLAYGRLGHVELPCQKVELEKIVKYVLEVMHDEIRDKSAQFEIQHPLPALLANDLVLQQILLNLFSNALKFVAPGVSPRVRIWAEGIGDKIHVNIQDNGIGIEPEHQQRIFRVFERLHRAEEYPGTGIGLAIVQKGIERMGGRVGVDSQRGTGSRFWIELPAVPAPKTPHPLPG